MAIVESEATGAQLVPVPHVELVPKALGGLPYLADFARLSEAIARTEMVPDTLRGRSDAVLAVVMAGYEMGVGPMQALSGINIIKGRPSPSPELMRALIMQAGHQIIVEASNEKAVARCHRKDWSHDQWSEFAWTMDDAKRAGLVRTNDGPWSKYPRSMLSARVTSEAGRAVFADVIAGLSYTPDEIEEFAPVPHGLSQPGEVSVVDPAVTVRVVDSMPAGEDLMSDLAETIRTTEPESERTRLVEYLRMLFGPSRDMEPDDIVSALHIAMEWPNTGPDLEVPAAPVEQAESMGAPF